MAKAKRPPQTRKKLGGPKVGGDGPRQNKVDAVQDFKNRVGSASAVLLTEYRGMTVGELAELRADLRQADADYRVVKNTLATIAARELGLEDFITEFQGPTAFTFAKGDPVAAAKKLSDFAKKVPALVLKGGLLDRKLLTSKDVSALGSLESREVLLAKAAGMFLSPLQNAVNLFAAPLNQLGSVLAQLRDKLPGEVTPGAPAAEISAPEPAAEAAPETAAEEPSTSAEAPAEPETPAAEAPADTTTEHTEG